LLREKDNNTAGRGLVLLSFLDEENEEKPGGKGGR
jgi:hypothetical protein